VALGDPPPFTVEPDNPALRERFLARCAARYGLDRMPATVLYVMLRGVTGAAEIAHALGRAGGTIENHLTLVYERLGVGDAAGAVARAWPTYLRAGEDVHLLRLGADLRAREERIDNGDALQASEP
jgi:DNA-binding CsgD family transcriptional regulator